MIRDELVSLETAKLAKEKGFPLRKVIKQDGRAFFYELPQSHPDWANCDAWDIPTQSLLQRWLREEKEVHIEIAHNPMYGGFMPFICKIVEGEEGVFTLLEKNCHCIAMRNATYEKALEAGLQYALEHYEKWDIKEE